LNGLDPARRRQLWDIHPTITSTKITCKHRVGGTSSRSLKTLPDREALVVGFDLKSVTRSWQNPGLSGSGRTTNKKRDKKK